MIVQFADDFGGGGAHRFEDAGEFAAFDGIVCPELLADAVAETGELAEVGEAVEVGEYEVKVSRILAGEVFDIVGILAQVVGGHRAPAGVVGEFAGGLEVVTLTGQMLDGEERQDVGQMRHRVFGDEHGVVTH